MAYVENTSGDCPTDISVYLTPLGRRRLLDTERPEQVRLSFFSASDQDVNYQVARALPPPEGRVPDLTGPLGASNPPVASCVFYDHTVPASRESCVTLAFLYALIAANGWVRACVAEPGHAGRRNIDDPGLTLDGAVEVDPSLDPELDYGAAFAAVYGYRTVQEMAYDARRREAAGMFVPFLCGREPVSCESAAVSPAPRCGTSWAGDDSAGSALLPSERTLMLPPANSTGVTVADWYFGATGDHIQITGGGRTFEAGAAAPHFRWGGAWAFPYSAGTVPSAVTVRVEPKVTALSDWYCTLHCPTRTYYGCGDSVTVLENPRAASRAYLVSAGTENRLISVRFQIAEMDAADGYALTLSHNGQTVAVSNGGPFGSGIQGYLKYSYAYDPAGQDFLVLAVRRAANRPVRGGDVTFSIACSN